MQVSRSVAAAEAAAQVEDEAKRRNKAGLDSVAGITASSQEGQRPGQKPLRLKDFKTSDTKVLVHALMALPAL